MYDAIERDGLYNERLAFWRWAYKLFDSSIYLLLLWLYLNRLFAGYHLKSVHHYYLSWSVYSSLLQAKRSSSSILTSTNRLFKVIILCLICWLFAPVFMFPLLLEHGGKRAATWNTEQFIW